MAVVSGLACRQALRISPGMHALQRRSLFVAAAARRRCRRSQRPWPVPVTASAGLPPNRWLSSAATAEATARASDSIAWKAVAALGLTAVGAVIFSTMSGKEMTFDIKRIDDDVFNTSDNMLVFFLENSEDLVKRKDEFHRVIKALNGLDNMKDVNYFYNLPSEGDPAVPAAANADDIATEPVKPLKVVLYKGQRKSIFDIGETVPAEKITEFFKPVSEKLSKKLRSLDVQRVCGDTFDEDVVDRSSPAKPVLVQIYEDSCFLCFLMRPFINSVAVLLKENNIPVEIKRFNIERNDFHPMCPVARGTPTFVFFTGRNGKQGEKWEEFKPRDIVDKLTKEFPNLPDEVFDTMDELQGLVTKRFQLFTQTVMWTIELNKLTAKVSAGTLEDLPLGEASDQDFNSVVQTMMAKDMARHDGILDNIAHLQKEVDEVEHDAAYMGIMLAEEVLRQERAE